MKTRDVRSLPLVAEEDLPHNMGEAVLDSEKQIEVARNFAVSRQAVKKWLKL